MSLKRKLKRSRKIKQHGMSNPTGISDTEMQEAFQKYRQDVSSVGKVSPEEAQAFLDLGRICRGSIVRDGDKEFFHIIKSPTNYPEKSIFYSDSEKNLFMLTVMMGMGSGIEFGDLFSES